MVYQPAHLRLATIRTGSATRAALVLFAARQGAITRDDFEATDLLQTITIGNYRDVGELLHNPHWRQEVEATLNLGEQHYVPVRAKDLAQPILEPKKIICVGMNYANHIAEMGRPAPLFPTLFIKFPDALTGPFDDVHVPAELSDALDYEGELAVVIGAPAYRVSKAQAGNYIAGFAIMNDYTLRDRQYRTLQWHQGKSLFRSAGFGPWVTVTNPDDPQHAGVLSTTVNGELRQHDSCADLVFDPTDLVEYISHLYPLNPGDVIVSGTPGGVGHAREPQSYLGHGDITRISIENLGHIQNRTLIDSTTDAAER